MNWRHKHGGVGTPTYKTWTCMKQRCLNPNNTDFASYGGRGIKVCERWLGLDGFKNFLADMGPRPDGMTLDRHPNPDGDYEPSNCRWADHIEQNNNKRGTRPIAMDGRTLTVAQWAREYGRSEHLIYNRLKRGWPEREAIVTPPKRGAA